MRIHGVILLGTFVFGAALMNAHADNGARLGATFSQQQCEYLNLDWKTAYEEITSMDFEFLRLGAYWSRIEKEKGKYDFSELDWQLQVALEKKIKVVLTVGMKAPRWPEYYLPQWLGNEAGTRKAGIITDNEKVCAETLRFIRVVISRYRDNGAIYAWQVENEPFNRAGPFDWRIGRDFLEQEIAAVRELDRSSRPIVVNVLTTPNSFLRFLSNFIYRADPVEEAIEVADIAAFNLYPVIGHKWWLWRFCFNAASSRMNAYMRSILRSVHAKKKRAWITELQAEPWEPGKLVHAEEDRALICPLQNYTEVFDEMRALGFDTIFLWGVEYWHFRKMKYNDTSWVDAMENIIPPHPSEPALGN